MTDERLAASRLHAVASESWRLREDALARLAQGWEGPVRRAVEPDDLETLLLGLDTPSLFEPAALWIVRCDERWLARHRARLAPLAGAPVAGGVLVLACEKLGRGDVLGRALAKAGALHVVEPPGGRELAAWLAERLAADARPADRPHEVAEILVRHRGEDVDALLAAAEQARLYAGEEPLDAAAANAVVGGDVEQPVWAFCDAVLSGAAGKAIRLLHAGRGLDPHQAAAVLAAELRKALACLASEDDRHAAALAGLRGQPRLYHARRRAAELGRRCLLRLLRGVLQVARDLRRSGVDDVLVVETYILNARRVIRWGGSGRYDRAKKRSRT